MPPPFVAGFLFSVLRRFVVCSRERHVSPHPAPPSLPIEHDPAGSLHFLVSLKPQRKRTDPGQLWFEQRRQRLRGESEADGLPHGFTVRLQHNLYTDIALDTLGGFIQWFSSSPATPPSV